MNFNIESTSHILKIQCQILPYNNQNRVIFFSLIGVFCLLFILLTYKDIGIVHALLYIGIFLLLSWLYASQSTLCIFDKRDEKISIIKRSFLSRKTLIYDFSDIAVVDLKEDLSHEYKGGKITLIMKSGENVNLCYPYIPEWNNAVAVKNDKRICQKPNC
jgi:hypothetical protein